MARNSGVSMPDSLIRTVNEHHVELGYQYKSRFVQEAVVDKLEEHGIDVDVEEIEHFDV